MRNTRELLQTAIAKSPVEPAATGPRHIGESVKEALSDMMFGPDPASPRGMWLAFLEGLEPCDQRLLGALYYVGRDARDRGPMETKQAYLASVLAYYDRGLLLEAWWKLSSVNAHVRRMAFTAALGFAELTDQQRDRYASYRRVS